MYSALGSHPARFEGKFGGTDLHKYAKAGNWSKLLACAEPSLFSTLNEHHRTPLHYALEQGAPDDVVLELIRLAPYQVRIPDDAKETPLHIGCEFGMGLIVVYSMLEADGTQARGQPSVLTLKNADGKTPLDILRESKKRFRTTLPWKYHADEKDGVMEILEETARGDTGLVGLAY